MNGPFNQDADGDSTRPSLGGPNLARGQSLGSAPYLDNGGLIVGELSPGFLINNQFKVLSTLGSGGMSYVYLCDDLALNRRVAVKVMRSMSHGNEQALMRFQREGKAVAMLSHHNVVKVHSLQLTKDEQPFLVMEVVNGVSLSQLIEVSGPLKLARALKFLTQICDGIAHAHDHGVIHRDLKLSNIMVINPDRADETVKILDFGIAKLADDTSVKMTQTGEVFGSPAYMSPEQALGKPVSGKSDQYSLGCIAFELLTGRTPFNAENYLAVLMSHVQEKAPSVNEFCRVPVPPNIEHTIAKLLSKNPEDRFENIGAVRKAFTGELAVTKTASAQWSSLFNSKNILIAAASLSIIGAIAASVWIIRYPKVPTVEKITQKLQDQDDIIDTLDEKSDDGILYGQVKLNKHITTFDQKLKDRKITDGGFRYIEDLPNLIDLDITGCEELTDKALEHLKKLPLQHLVLNKTNFTDAGINTVANLSTLKDLSIDGDLNLTSKGVEALVRLPNLQILFLSDNAFKGDALKHIGKMKHLTILHLDNDEIASGLKYLSDLNLHVLSISGCATNTQNLLQLVSMTSLRELHIDNDDVSEKAFLKFATLPNLRILTLNGSRFSDEAIAKFRKLNPTCKLTLQTDSGNESGSKITSKTQ